MKARDPYPEESSIAGASRDQYDAANITWREGEREGGRREGGREGGRERERERERGGREGEREREGSREAEREWVKAQVWISVLPQQQTPG